MELLFYWTGIKENNNMKQLYDGSHFVIFQNLLFIIEDSVIFLLFD